MHLANTMRALHNKWSSFAINTKNKMIDLFKKVLDKWVVDEVLRGTMFTHDSQNWEFCRSDIDIDTAQIEIQEAVLKHYKEAATTAENLKLSPAETANSYLSLAKYSEGLFIENHDGINYCIYPRLLWTSLWSWLMLFRWQSGTKGNLYPFNHESIKIRFYRSKTVVSYITPVRANNQRKFEIRLCIWGKIIN